MPAGMTGGVMSSGSREIAAWWLRRRMVGVFGPGEVYSQTVQTLQTDPDPVRRSYAANALGEFFVRPCLVDAQKQEESTSGKHFNRRDEQVAKANRWLASSATVRFWVPAYRHCCRRCGAFSQLG